jgi:hypothetical protein
MLKSPVQLHNNPTALAQGCWTLPQFAGLNVYLKRGPLVTEYLHAIHQTIGFALKDSPRTLAIRVDLHLPVDFDCDDTAVISRFFASLNAQLEAADKKNERIERRVHPNQLRYVWVREIGKTGRPHYHVLLLLNHDRYRTLGSFESDEGNLSARIKKAWASALARPLQQVANLVHFPENPKYVLDVRSPIFQQQLDALFYRVSYFAKLQTKVFGSKQRSFATSRN